MEFIFGCNIKVVQCSGKVRNMTILILVSRRLAERKISYEGSSASSVISWSTKSVFHEIFMTVRAI